MVISLPSASHYRILAESDSGGILLVSCGLDGPFKTLSSPASYDLSLRICQRLQQLLTTSPTIGSAATYSNLIHDRPARAVVGVRLIRKPGASAGDECRERRVRTPSRCFPFTALTASLARLWRPRRKVRRRRDRRSRLPDGGGYGAGAAASGARRGARELGTSQTATAAGVRLQDS